MRLLGLRLLVCLAIFAAYSRAEAASVNLTLAQVPGTTVWDLEMTSLTPVGAVGVTVTSTLLTFTPVDGRIQGYPGSCALGSSAFCVPYLLLSFAPPILATSQTLLGYFNSSDPTDEALLSTADYFFGGTAFDATGAPLDYSLSTIPNPVPEPALAGFVALGLLGALIRRRR